MYVGLMSILISFLKLRKQQFPVREERNVNDVI